jgi:membrane-associated phospholipid phosphatase
MHTGSLLHTYIYYRQIIISAQLATLYSMHYLLLYPMKYVITLLLICQLYNANAQLVADSSHQPASIAHYIKSYWKNGTQFITQPIRWQGKDWAIFSGSLAIAAGLYSIDERINNPFKKWGEKNNTFGKVGGFVGGTPVIVSSAAATLIVALATKNKPLQSFAKDHIQAQIFNSSFTLITKNMFGRARPYQGRGAYYWDGPFKANKYESFFSGHTSAAFATATMVYLHSHKKPWVGLLSYAMASAIGISRMQYQRHWASDVFMGAVSGWATAAFVYKQNHKKEVQVARLKKVL